MDDSGEVVSKQGKWGIHQVLKSTKEPALRELGGKYFLADVSCMRS